jgi:hypothetical protein
MGVKHKGLCRHRLEPNPGEQVFADAWEKVNKENKILSLLLSKGENGTEWDVSQRDATVAATVIQWLATGTGRNWLRDAIHKADDAEYKAMVEGPEQKPEDGRIPIKDRPKKGEVWHWKPLGWKFEITYVDPFGRWFDYTRQEPLADGTVDTKTGQIGQTEVMTKRAVKVKNA